MKNSKAFLYILWIFYTLISIFGLLDHELWLDEAHHWLFARDSSSISDLFHNSRYDGHPLLWETILFFFSKISQTVATIKVVHLAISCGACYLFLFYSPFKIIEKFLIIFSYFLLFEYNLISRNYGLGWFFIVLFLVLFFKQKRKDVFIVSVLILLANTHLFFSVISFSLFLLLMNDRIRSGRSLKASVFIAFGYLAGLSLAIWQIVPPMDDSFIVHLADSSPVISKEKFNNFLTYFTKAGYYVPDFTTNNFWNSNYIFTHFKWLAFILSFVTVLLPFLIFKRRATFFLFYSSSLVIAILLYILPLKSLHYIGFWFLLLIAGIWLDTCYTKSPIVNKAALLPISIVSSKYLFLIMLVVQFFSGISSYYKHMKYPFSEGKNVAEYITRVRSGKSKVMAVNAGPPVAAYLNEKIYYPEEDHWATFNTWTLHYLRDAKSIAERIKKELKTISNTHVFLLIGDRNAQSDSLVSNVKSFISPPYSVNVFNRAIVKGENYTVIEFNNK